jgi:hypothetical protein
MKLTGKNRRTRGKTCPSATFSTTNLTWTDLVLFFLLIPGFFPFDPFLFCISPFSSFHVTYGPQPSFFLQHNTNIHAPGGIRTHDPSKRAAVDPRLRPHSNPSLRGERLATNRLSHGTAL